MKCGISSSIFNDGRLRRDKVLKRKVFAVIVSMVAWQHVYAACDQGNNKVTFVGLDGSNGQIYVDVSQHDNRCSCNYFRFSPSNTKVDMALSILMAAQLAEKKVRIDALEAGNCNTAYRVYMY